MHADLAHVESWIFDLDNSLYPHGCNLFELIDLRMGEYIQRLLGVDALEARRVQKGISMLTAPRSPG
jgi:putative hydrolase of the HAD superfamily